MIRFLDLQAVNAAYSSEILEATRRVVDSGWYLLGEEARCFEAEYADYIALTLIYRAYIEMGIMAPGDEVIVPANTYIATILSLTENGLKPVLVEPQHDTLEIDDTQIEQVITSRTRSILIVHLYGRCAYTERIGQLCQRYGLKLVEDNAQAHGCHYSLLTINSSLKRTGALGDAAGHSFYPGKNLGALGDGGAVTTDDQELAATVRALGNYGSVRKYVFQYKGRNSRLDELQAAVLRVKLRHLDADNRRRQQLAAYYYDHLANPLVSLPLRMDDAQNVYHIFPVLARRRDDLQAYLKAQGIETLIHYPIPPPRQACYSELSGLSLPTTERIHAEELSLPISPVMTIDEARQVCQAVNQFK